MMRKIPILIILILMMCTAVSAESIIFLHHSTGQGLIDGGNVREGLTALGHDFYDHGYNGDGLTDASGTRTGENFDVPGDNTDPDGLADIFSQPVTDPPSNTLSHLLEYDVIIFKSCFPTSVIDSEYQLTEYKRYYLTIRDTIDSHPDKLFVLFTMPPEVPANTNPSAAGRARKFTEWLKSDTYIGGRSNIAVFDFFDLLADSNNVLKSRYRGDEYDAHPNDVANREIGPIFVSFVDDAINGADLSGYAVPVLYEEEVDEEPLVYENEEEEPVAVPTSMPARSPELIDGFETEYFGWESYTDGTATELTCTVSPKTNTGNAGMQIDYDIMNGGYADCGRNFDTQDWSGYDGIEMWLNTDNMGQYFNFVIFTQIDGENVPYQAEIMTTDTMTRGWSKIFLPWSIFGKADWAEGPSSPSLNKVVGINFNFEARGADQTGTVYVDDLMLGREYEVVVSGQDNEMLVMEEPPAREYKKETVQDVDAAGTDRLVLYLGLGLLLLVGILVLVWVLVRKK